MDNTLEIRWHGRGGQGAKTAALLLADVAFKTGAYVQGFPEYGPERMGAPITAFNRISRDRIRVHSNIYEPDFVVVVDETLLHSVHVTDGLKRVRGGDPAAAAGLPGRGLYGGRAGDLGRDAGEEFPQYAHAGGRGGRERCDEEGGFPARDESFFPA